MNNQFPPAANKYMVGGPQPPYASQPGQPAPYGSQPPYASQPGQSPFNTQPGQPPFNTQPGQPPYTSQPGQPAYGQPGQPAYGQPGQPQPGYGAPGQPAPYGAKPPGQPYSAQPPYGSQPGQPAPYGTQPGQPAPYASQPAPYGTQPGQPAPYGNPAPGQYQAQYAKPPLPTGQPPYGQPTAPYGSQPAPYGSQPGQPPYASQPGQPPYGQPPMMSGVSMNPPLARISLVKGQNVSLTKAAPNLRRARVGLGWDVRQTWGAAFDLDASVFLLNAQNVVTNPMSFIFYNNKQSYDGSIIHYGDNLTGMGEGDDEQVSVDLTRVPPDIQRIVFVCSIHEADIRQQNFGMVQRAFIRIVDQDSLQEIVRFDLTEEASAWNCILFGELYRYGPEWKFKALGTGVPGGLRGAGAQFGMQLA